MARTVHSVHAEDDLHYKKLGLKRDEIQLWEDGMRTDGGRNSYEWWYSDFSFDDGTKLVIVFYTKNPVKGDGGLCPFISVDLTLPDGRYIYDQSAVSPEHFYGSKEKCLVINGDSRIVGDLKDYEIIFNGPKIKAEIKLTGTIPAWRSQTGTIFFGDNDEHYFSWLPAVPEGTAEAHITFEGKEFDLKGSGYHDHNWGDVSMFRLMHHWYWGRAKIGDYKVISSWITAAEKYGYNEFDIFMLAKGSEILGDNSNHTLKFLPEDEYTDEVTGKPVYGKIVYEYVTPGGEEYRITFDRKEDLSKEFFYQSLPRSLRPLAKLVGFNGSYQRFTGSAAVERIENGVTVESVTEETAVWELMYFGKAGADKEYMSKK